MIEHPVHDDVDAPGMKLVDQPLQAEQLVERLSRIMGVAILDGEEGERVVAPAERAAGPCRPRHELDGIDAQGLQVVELVPHGIQGCAVAAELGGEIVDHQLVEDELLERLPPGDRLYHRGVAADDEARVLVHVAAILGAGIAAPAGLAVLERD